MVTGKLKDALHVTHHATSENHLDAVSLVSHRSLPGDQQGVDGL
jgi:hypothetical protein